ncbi:synaptonemal complex protein 2 [Oncorhynchus tshawytscha]|nr:synaptonemal complex protein 2 [Oncorhynchus tshawytscha]
MMAPPQDPQLEKLVDEVLKNSNFQALGDFLQDDEGTTWRCSKQFLAKLDKLVSRELDHRNVKHACLGLTILHKFGKNLALPGGQGLSGMVLQGLVKKMVQWFEKARMLWIEACTQRNETLLNLAEDLFDSVMVVHETSLEGTYQVTECFLHLIGQLAADPRIHIMIQKEAIRKLNIILDKIPAELKKEKKILSSQEASDLMNNLASRIVEGGDYDLQIALMEALCRMTTRAQRKELADDWFSMEFVASTFSKIQDSEFETDCRRFLNLLNGMQGDGRRVFSYPCLEVFLDKHELLMPADEKLEEFWIDFNLGSQSVSFYFSLADEDAQEGQWDTACIPENEVHSYTVTEEGRRRVLKLKLTEPLCVSGVEGSHLTIHFSSSLDIMQAARSVYGNKNKSFVGKRRTSVVKTTVKIVMDDNCSQALVPESQMSPDADMERERDSVPCLLPPRPSGPLQMVTPAKRRVSESSTFITSSGGGRGTGASPFSVVMAASTPRGSRPKVKPAIELVRSCERQGQSGLGELRTAKPHYNAAPGITLSHSRSEQMDAVVALSQSKATKQDTRAGPVAEKYRRHIPVDKVVEMVQTDQAEEEELLDSSIVPDSQPTMKTESTIFSHWRKVSVSEMLLPVQRGFQKALPKPELENVEQQERPSSAQRGSGSVPGSAVSHKQLHAQLTQRLEEVLRKRDRGTGPEERAGVQIRVPEERGGPQDRGSRERAGAQGGSGPEEQSGAQGGRGPEEQDGARGGRGPEERGEPTGRGAKVSRQDAGRPGQTKGKPKSQKSQETEATPGKAPVKPTPAKDIQERATPNSKVKATGSNSSKDKREEVVTGTMMRLISSHYENSTSSTTIKSPVESVPRWPLPPTNRSVLEKSWLPPSMVGTAKAQGYMKSYTNSKKPSAEQQGDDVFAFKVDTSMTTGGEGKMSSDTSAIDSSATHNSWAFPSTAKKGQAVKSQVAAQRRHVKKHLFSDTDTDAMMEISWLKESSRKPKPKVIDYSRQPRLHPPAPNTTYESPDLPPSSPKPVKEKAKPKKKRQRVKERSVEQKENSGAALVAAGTSQAARRPQRAAATNAKSYREPDSASQSETEEPPAPKKRSIGPAEKIEKVCQEAVEVKKKKATTPAKEQTNVPKESSWAARLASFKPSPPAIERMRAASERSLIALPRSLLTPLGSLSASPASGPSSPLALELPPEHPRSSAGFQPSSFYSAPGRKSDRKAKDPSLPSLPSFPSLTPTGKTPGLRAQRPSALELSPIQPALSPAQSPLLCPPSQLLLTSTALQKSVLPSPLLQSQPSPGETDQFALHFGFPGQLGLPESFDKESLVSRVKLSQSSSRSEMSSTRVEAVNPVALTTALEKTPYSERRHKLDQRSFHLSGPCTGRKRHNSRPSSSNSEEEGKSGTRRGRQAVKMRPRKLFKPTAKPNLHAQAQAWEEQSSSDEEEEEEKKGNGTKDRASLATTKIYHHIQSSKSARDTVMDVSPEGDLSRVVSSHMVTSSSWEADVEAEVEGELDRSPHDMGNMCRQFSSELQRKFQNRSRRMELYTKQSLKTVQQHVSSISMRVQNYRSQKLEQVRGVLLKEINNLEEDESTLKNMEKELTTYWRKQSVAFHSYQEKETRRLQSLKSTFQTDVCHSLEYEERIFTSQMCLMRKDMKSVQDRLFKEMQDEEIMSVRRGLQALFLPEGPRF